VLTDLRIDEGAQVILELGVCSFLIQAAQAAVSSHICRKNGDEPSHQVFASQELFSSL
jgi:hypothetical protein